MKAAYDLIGKVGFYENAVRLVFFGCPTDNGEYLDQYRFLGNLLRATFQDKVPAYSYVAQPLLGSGCLGLELQLLEGYDIADCQYKKSGDLHYVKVGKGETGALFLSAVFAKDMSMPIGLQAEASFEILEKLINDEGLDVSGIVRQWNYIEHITDVDENGRQRYQEFNDIRSRFYGDSFVAGGYPAATGIGTCCGGVQIEVDVIGGAAGRSLRIDNPNQRSAYLYSLKVLVGGNDVTTPKFERARFVSLQEGEWIYISGTAAIRGELTCDDDIFVQTDLTIENINMLLEQNNLSEHGVTGQAHLKSLRVYVKHGEDLDCVRQKLQKTLPGLEVIYVQADVCRDNLLVEMEGVAEVIR